MILDWLKTTADVSKLEESIPWSKRSREDQLQALTLPSLPSGSGRIPAWHIAVLCGRGLAFEMPKTESVDPLTWPFSLAGLVALMYPHEWFPIALAWHRFDFAAAGFHPYEVDNMVGWAVARQSSGLQDPWSAASAPGPAQHKAEAYRLGHTVQALYRPYAHWDNYGQHEGVLSLQLRLKLSNVYPRPAIWKLEDLDQELTTRTARAQASLQAVKKAEDFIRQGMQQEQA